MRDATRAALDELRVAEWFSHSGTALQDPAALALLSWPDAVTRFTSVGWENFRLERRNEFTGHLASGFVERFRQFNDLHDEIERLLTPIIDAKIRHVVTSHKLPKKFRDAVRWDLRSACLEVEFSDVVPPAFHAMLGSWYLRGRLPCDWIGRYPAGRLLVL